LPARTRRLRGRLLCCGEAQRKTAPITAGIGSPRMGRDWTSREDFDRAGRSPRASATGTRLLSSPRSRPRPRFACQRRPASATRRGATESTAHSASKQLGQPADGGLESSTNECVPSLGTKSRRLSCRGNSQLRSSGNRSIAMRWSSVGNRQALRNPQRVRYASTEGSRRLVGHQFVTSGFVLTFPRYRFGGTPAAGDLVLDNSDLYR